MLSTEEEVKKLEEKKTISFEGNTINFEKYNPPKDNEKKDE